MIGPSPVPWSPVNQVPRPMTARGHGRRARRVRARHRDGAGVRLRHGRAALRPRLSAVCVHHAAHEPAADEYGGTLANRLRFPLEVFAAMRQCGPGTSRCRCASPRPTGSRAASPAMTRSRSPGRSRPGRGSSTCPPARPARARSPSTAACSRRRFPIVFATRRASRPWRSATSSSPITSTASSRPRADLLPLTATIADPYWPACRRASSATIRSPGQQSIGRSSVRNLKRAADLAIAGMSPGAAGALDGRHAGDRRGRGIGAAIATRAGSRGRAGHADGPQRGAAEGKARSAAGRAGDLLRRDRRSRRRAAFRRSRTCLWPGGDPDQQRWRRGIGAVRAHLARAAAADAGRQPDRHVPVQPGGTPGHARSGLRPDRQCRKHRGPEGRAYVSAYCAAKHGVAG